MSDEIEEWRDIPGFDGYQASTMGRVRSARHKQFSLIGWRVLKPTLSRQGYHMIKLSAPTLKRFTRGAHSWVALTFHGPRPDGLQVRHLDGDKSNNRPGNLVYGTAQENSDDKIRHGTQLRGSAHHSGKLTEEDVRSIRMAIASGAPGVALAREYGVSPTAILAIKKGRAWKWLHQNHHQSDAA